MLNKAGQHTSVILLRDILLHKKNIPRGKNIEQHTSLILPHNISQLVDLNKNSSVCDDMSTMADENIILFLGYRLLIKKIKKINRKMWVHPLVSSRPSEGAFTLVFEGLRRDPDKFLIFFVWPFLHLMSCYPPTWEKNF